MHVTFPCLVDNPKISKKIPLKQGMGLVACQNFVQLGHAKVTSE